MIWRGVFLLLAALTVVYAQSEATYHTCAESEVCSYLRGKEPTPNEFTLITTFITPYNNTIRIPILRNNTNVLNLYMSFYKDDIIRLQVFEQNDPNRYYLDTVLNGTPEPDDNFNFISQGGAQTTVIWAGSHNLMVTSNPFTVQIYNNQDLIAIFNNDGRLVFEHDGSSRAVGFDINFPNATHAYGLPLHAENIFLRETTVNGSDPYRLYNLNVENYQTNSTKALSGNIPVLYAHGSGISAGVFFHNGYETWVDLTYTSSGVNTHFMVEDGIFDAFVLLGPTPVDVYKQYLSLTGVAPLPPAWALGYHHTATSDAYQSELIETVSSFDIGNFPIDAIWVQNHDRSFEWDSELYDNPLALQNFLAETNRKLVSMIKPSLSVELEYPILDEAVNNFLLVLTDGRFPFIGKCDAGNCTWWDFINPSTFTYYTSLFSYFNYPQTTSTLAGFWTEANEPLVLDAEERALPRDNIHFSGFTHKDIHNIYSHNMNLGTYFGQLQRDNGYQRPFVISESFFAGTQRYAGIYTGKTSGTWDHLRTSFRMCLAAGMTGIHFCGSNIGGYFGDVSEELLTRWYQLGAWLPLFRSHYSDESTPREPYLLSTTAQNNIRNALRIRYTHLAVWYTLLYEHERNRNPVIQPLFFKYPTSLGSQHEDSFFIGENIFVSPVTAPGATFVVTYLVPGEIWYDVDNNLVYFGYGGTVVNALLDRIPTFYRGGAIIPRQDNPQRNAIETLNGVFSVYVFLDSNDEARGTLYIDDRTSFNYRVNRIYYYISLNFTNGAVSFSQIDSDASYPGASFIVDRYLLYRPSTTLKSGRDSKPEYIEPEIYTHSSEGRAFRYTPLDLSKPITVQLY